MLNRAVTVLLFILVPIGAAVMAQKPNEPADTLMVMPFENKSDKPEFNWVGESFAESVGELLVNRRIGIVSNPERKLIQQDLKVPLTSIPSLATSLWIATRAKASLLMVGSYTLPPTDSEGVNTIKVLAKIIRVRDGKILREDFPTGGYKDSFDLGGALSNLQTIQGDLAYQSLLQIGKILYKQEPLEVKNGDFVSAANKVPAKAFEAYVKGLLTTNLTARENYYKNALQLYAGDKDHPGEVFSSAALELGHHYLAQGKRDDAVEPFRSVINAFARCRDAAVNNRVVPQCRGDQNAEASYYLAWIYLQNKNYEQAISILSEVKDLKLVSIYNLLGTVGIKAARAEKSGSPKAANYLVDAIKVLARTAETVPADRQIAFNHALALFLNGNYEEAAPRFRDLLVPNVADGEAAFLAAKAFETVSGREKEALAHDDLARRLLTGQDRYAKLQQTWNQSKSIDSIDVRITPASRDDFVEVIFVSRRLPVKTPLDPTEELLSQARSFFKEGKYDEAIEKLRRVIASEPMQAESYLILGKIYLSRGEIDQAINHFKTAIFWDNRLIDPPVALTKIYVQKGECQFAKTYEALARELAPNNPDVVGLQRMVERCSK